MERFFATGDARRLSVQNAKRIANILRALDDASRPEDMNLPGFRFHALVGREKGRYAINASGNWRITFGWIESDAVDVDLEKLPLRTGSMIKKLPKRGLPPMHPGELLRDEILPVLGRPKTEIAKLLGVSRQTHYDVLARGEAAGDTSDGLAAREAVRKWSRPVAQFADAIRSAAR